jgi:hypothetical protein
MAITTSLGVLKKYDNIRDVWPDEDADFSPWLEKNIDLLGDKIGLSLEVVERESPVGDFTVDMLARDINSSATVVIENQLSTTDHNHLGQIITYAAGKTATYVVWIVQTAREEHKAAIKWLNDSTGEEIGFFLLEIQLWQIDDSLLSPTFYIAEAPNGWTKNNKRPACSFCGTSEKIKYNFWSEFVSFAFVDSTFSKEFRSHSPWPSNVYSLGMGTSDAYIILYCNTRDDSVGLELRIARKDVYDDLLKSKASIEASIGQPLNWDRLDNKKTSRIRLDCDKNFRNPAEKMECFKWLMRQALAYKRTFAGLI